MKSLKIISLLVVAALAGCATAPASQPIAYLAVEKPKGVIKTGEQKMEKEYSRSGWYFGNYNFRPAADLSQYLSEAQSQVNSPVLRNVDVELRIPFAFDLLFCGYAVGHDVVTVQAQAETAASGK